MDLPIISLFFMIGTAVGSFLNVCAYRIPKGESIAFPASHCPSCGAQIKPLDNIPIVSYVLLGGRCRNCKQKISLKYPAVELLAGILWAAAYYHFGLGIELIYGLFFITVLVVLSAIDYDTKTIPNKILLPATVITLLMLPLYFLNIETPPTITGMNAGDSLIGLLAGGGFLLLVAILGPVIFKKNAMGMGDVKLAAFMGLFLGGYVLLALFIGFFIGAVVGIALIATGKRTAKDMIPFGPFLASGAIITVFIGPQLWKGYLAFAGLA